jgi:HEPN domain-containing protein
MNPLTLEWVNKADEDFIAAERLLRVRKTPVYSVVCFHSQQCAEKLLKALLQEQQQHIPKTHHLADLLTLIVQVDASCQFLRSDLKVLEDYAVDFRYPGNHAGKDDAKLALKAARNVRMFIRSKLNLPS